jgi:uncharacterized CHY-type Zn-finger protein
MGGMGGVAYSSSFSNGTIDLRNNVLESPRRPQTVERPRIVERLQTVERPQRVGTSITYGEPVNKPILIIDASNCPILCEQIAIGERYMSCHQCVNNFSEQALKQWLESRRPNNRTCPLCRVQWSNFEIYINSEPIPI